jgi:hypothetical protein
MIASALLIALIFQFAMVVINKIYCISLGIDMPFYILLVIIPIIYLTEVIPFSINGIGIRDGAFVLFFVLFGYSSEDGLAVALMVLAMRYLYGLIGGLLFLTDPDRETIAD